MIVAEPIYTKLTLAQQRFVKNSYAESYKILTNSLVADTRSQTDGRK
jgi:hypothetical protein